MMLRLEAEGALQSQHWGEWQDSVQWLLASPLKSLRKLFQEIGMPSLSCYGRQRKKEFPRDVIMLSCNWNPLTSIKGCPIASAFKHVLSKILTSWTWRGILMGLCFFCRDMSTHRIRSVDCYRSSSYYRGVPPTESEVIVCFVMFPNGRLPFLPHDRHFPRICESDDRELTLRCFQQDVGDASQVEPCLRRNQESLWVPMSRDITPPAFFLWDLLKNRIVINKPRIVDDVKRNYKWSCWNSSR
jgi:hypothetical protein